MFSATFTYTLTCDWHREPGGPVGECRSKLVIHGETTVMGAYARARRERWGISFYTKRKDPQRVVTRCPEHTHWLRRIPPGRPAGVKKAA